MSSALFPQEALNSLSSDSSSSIWSFVSALSFPSPWTWIRNFIAARFSRGDASDDSSGSEDRVASRTRAKLARALNPKPKSRVSSSNADACPSVGQGKPWLDFSAACLQAIALIAVCVLIVLAFTGIMTWDFFWGGLKLPNPEEVLHKVTIALELLCLATCICLPAPSGKPGLLVYSVRLLACIVVVVYCEHHLQTFAEMQQKRIDETLQRTKDINCVMALHAVTESEILECELDIKTECGKTTKAVSNTWDDALNSATILHFADTDVPRERHLSVMETMKRENEARLEAIKAKMAESTGQVGSSQLPADLTPDLFFNTACELNVTERDAGLVSFYDRLILQGKTRGAAFKIASTWIKDVMMYQFNCTLQLCINKWQFSDAKRRDKCIESNVTYHEVHEILNTTTTGMMKNFQLDPLNRARCDKKRSEHNTTVIDAIVYSSLTLDKYSVLRAPVANETVFGDDGTKLARYACVSIASVIGPLVVISLFIWGVMRCLSTEA